MARGQRVVLPVRGKEKRRRNLGIDTIDTTVRLPADVVQRIEADTVKNGRNNVSWEISLILEGYYGIDRSRSLEAVAS